MRYYGIKKKRISESFFYNAIKTKYAISAKLKKESRTPYRTLFRDHPRFRNDNSAIPSQKHYTPMCIIASDLVLREDIKNLQTGLIKLIKKHLTHKFMGGRHSIKEIISNISKMDNTYSSWYNWSDIGRFDFDNSITGLSEDIAYFDIYIRNINSSYLALEVYIYLSDKFKDSLATIINNDFHNKKGYITPIFSRKKDGGGKKSYTVTFFNDDFLKSDLIYETINILKWKLFNYLQKYCPVLLHGRNIIPPSVICYKTNIPYRDESARHFWHSVGINEYYGQFIDESRKLFFKIQLSGRYKDNHRTDLVYIVNEDTINRSVGYLTVDDQVISEFIEIISAPLFKFLTLDTVNSLAAIECVKYKTMLNRIKLKKNKLNKILKLRYSYEKNIDFFRRYISDDIWKKASKKIEELFDNKQGKLYDYRTVTESPIMDKNNIYDKINFLDKDFENKIIILQHLAAYKNETKNRIINYIMLILTSATVVFIIFPDMANSVADYLIHFGKNLIFFLFNFVHMIFS